MRRRKFFTSGIVRKRSLFNYYYYEIFCLKKIERDDSFCNEKMKLQLTKFL